MSKDFLFSIDLEDPRENIWNKDRYEDRVNLNVMKLLDWLENNNSKTTFFVVGKIAERYPDLVKQIFIKGHEIACHSYSHIPINHLGKKEFENDLVRNIEAIINCGVPSPIGFRAPTFSLIESSFWAYNILRNNGIKYSSSVLPAKNPLFGIPNFGQQPKYIDGILEIPVTISNFLFYKLPIAGGIYLRILPKHIILAKARNFLSTNYPLVSYIHPYDIDVNQNYFMHEHINNHILNYLMYFNRKNTLLRLDSFIDLDYNIITYERFFRDHLSKNIS